MRRIHISEARFRTLAVRARVGGVEPKSAGKMARKTGVSVPPWPILCGNERLQNPARVGGRSIACADTNPGSGRQSRGQTLPGMTMEIEHMFYLVAS